MCASFMLLNTTQNRRRRVTELEISLFARWFCGFFRISSLVTGLSSSLFGMSRGFDRQQDACRFESVRRQGSGLW
jgi:hypothetical protein